MEELLDHDPDAYALLMVQQWLHERGHTKALQSLEEECGLRHDPDKLRQGSTLMQWVWERYEAAISQQDLETAAHEMHEEELLVRAGVRDAAEAVAGALEGRHPGNIICCAVARGGGEIFTASGDGVVRCFRWPACDAAGGAGSEMGLGDMELEWAQMVGAGAALCVESQPSTGASSADVADRLLAATSMDGTVSVLSAATGQLICSAKPHRKYVVKARWLPADGGSCFEAGGARLATVSHDQTICFLQVPAPPHEEVQVLRQVPAASTPTDIALVGCGAESTLIVSLRDTNYLRRFSMQALEAAELDPVNMNASGDDHISFSALHLSASGCGRYLLASTDQARILMFSTASWRVVRSFYGLSTEQFHTPCTAWHHDGRYIYAAGAGGVLFIYEVGSAKVLATVKVHNVNIRHMVYDMQSRQLFTCSYDKTVKALRSRSSSVPRLGAED